MALHHAALDAPSPSWYVVGYGSSLEFFGARARRAVGDILIGATASVHALPLVTRNRRDFEPMTKVVGSLSLLDWSR